MIDAELLDRPPPPALALRHGAADFWGRWTRTECAAKAAGVPIARWLRRHGLDAPATSNARTVVLGEIVVSLLPIVGAGAAREASGGPAREPPAPTDRRP